MSIERGRAYLRSLGLEDRVKEFSVSSATVKDAAIAVGCSEGEIAKTLSFMQGETPVLILTAGDVKIDNGKYKASFHCKAKMIPSPLVEPLIGHGVGGVCPFGINPGVQVYLDASLKRFSTVYPACGSSHSAVKLSIEELEGCSGYLAWVDVCRGMEA